MPSSRDWLQHRREQRRFWRCEVKRGYEWPLSWRQSGRSWQRAPLRVKADERRLKFKRLGVVAKQSNGTGRTRTRAGQAHHFDHRRKRPVADIVARWQSAAMVAFRIVLIALWVILAGYTAVVISRYGLGLLPVFFGDIASIGWPGQFNLDFLCFLMLSAAWTAWRNAFSTIGLFLALIAFFGGAGFLLPYLFFLTLREKGDTSRVLVGTRPS